MLYHADCLEGLAWLPADSVSLVFADLPYGRTQNDWDKQVPIKPLWVELRRVCRQNAAMVFTAVQPFTSMLVTSNLSEFRYCMVWRKNKSSGFLNAKRQPLRIHEDIVVFYARQPAFAPPMSFNHRPVNAYGTAHGGVNYGKTKRMVGGGSTSRYPTTLLDMPVVNNDDPERIHPTQKPIELPSWFISAYTKEDDLVLDPTAGSGTTLLAAKRMGRRYVGFETSAIMVEAARRRLARENP